MKPRVQHIGARSKQDAITVSRHIVETNEYTDDNERAWLQSFVDSYNNEKYRTEIHVLEGSPARGYVVVNGHDCGTATSFNIGDHVIAKVNWGM